MSLLSVENIDVFYQDLHALRAVSVAVGEGQAVAVLGPNGAGKSTLLRAISRIVEQRSGTISLGDRSLDRVPAHRIADAGVAHVPEGRRIFAALTVEENLLIGGYRKGARPARQQTLNQVYELFPNLAARRSQPGGNLSGGEQQMLAVGRALMQLPTLLMLDEPSLGLAPAVVSELYRKLTEVRERGVSVLLVEQQAPQALRIADFAYVLAAGSVVASGRPDELQRQDSFREAYLGL
jgi:branched-chain amino acid transport system ATP-binding protein